MTYDFKTITKIVMIVKNVVAVSVSLPPHLIKRIDKERVDVSRSKFVLRLLEKALENSKK